MEGDFWQKQSYLMPQDGIPLVSLFVKMLLSVLFPLWIFPSLSIHGNERSLICVLIGKLVKQEKLPKDEHDFQKRYVKAPSFLSIHMGIKADVLPPDTDCHHFMLEVLYIFLLFEHFVK